MQVLSKGYKQPDIDDKSFWDAMRFNIQRLNDHNHDGNNSTPLAIGAVAVHSELVEVADWVGASAPYYYDVLFPPSRGISWADNTYCPVQVVVRDSAENPVYLEQARAPSGAGVRVYTHVKANYLVGFY